MHSTAARNPPTGQRLPRAPARRCSRAVLSGWGCPALNAEAMYPRLAIARGILAVPAAIRPALSADWRRLAAFLGAEAIHSLRHQAAYWWQPRMYPADPGPAARRLPPASSSAA